MPPVEADGRHQVFFRVQIKNFVTLFDCILFKSLKQGLGYSLPAIFDTHIETLDLGRVLIRQPVQPDATDNLRADCCQPEPCTIYKILPLKRSTVIAHEHIDRLIVFANNAIGSVYFVEFCTMNPHIRQSKACATRMASSLC